MFLSSTHASLLLDTLKIPYEVAGGSDCGVTRISASSGRPVISWRRREVCEGDEAVGAYRLEGIPLCVRLDTGVPSGSWMPATPVTEPGGSVGAWVQRDAEGAIHLPFDPDEAIGNTLREVYDAIGTRGASAPARRAAFAAYYAAKPYIPRSAQLAIRRRFARIQARRAFPRWPIEDGLHQLYDWLVGCIAEAIGAPIPTIASWPGGRTWCLVLTHDVEQLEGYRRLPVLRDVERSLGLRSSWNFVPERHEPHARYEVEPATVDRLVSEGCEVGVHGLRHDGRDLASLQILEQRLPAIRAAADRWGAVGFRSPATHRTWDWMPLLGFDYDSSYPDTDPFEPRSGGCCSLLPFMNRDMVELPITLPQDHTLFSILGERDERLWVEKTEHIRRRGGMALALTHPDYASSGPLARSYGSYLERYRDDPGVWHALPREVSAWWRRRLASSLVHDGERWRIAGPAADDGRVVLVGARGVPTEEGPWVAHTS